MKRIMMIILLFIVWILLAWPVNIQEVVAGLIVAVLAGLIMRDVTSADSKCLLNPIRLFWLVIYTVVLAYYIVKANFDVAYRVLHPAMPINPGIVKIRTELKTLAGITALSNSITLTPGTLTVDVLEGGILYVHCINVKSTDVKKASRQIIGRFEWFLKKIFE